MTNKLTCKMSDGTEWEVDEPPQKQSYLKELGGDLLQQVTGYRFTASPIKRKPREGWIIHGRGDRVIFHRTKEEAFKDAVENTIPIVRRLGLSIKDEDACKEVSEYLEVIKVREVLDEEEKEK